ncbi:MAG: hypothetical protein EOO10_01910 [Chitinophagaceae bacterium]|nr:MAG: hypothetical protein EOO10_01910 [Chitinophagaceae bacterium]
MRTKKGIFILILFMYNTVVNAQQQTYDIISFTPPKGWKKENPENVFTLSTTNNKTKAWAQIGVVKSTASKGSIEADFESEWKELIVKPYQQYGVTEKPLGIDTQSLNGWKVCTGLGKFVFNKDTAAVLLTTFSNSTRCASVRVMSNSTSYGPVLDQFIASIDLPGAKTSQGKNDVTVNSTTTAPVATGFQFNTTNFDDGWISIVKEDWVEATKGNIKVLLHYPREEDKNYYSQYEERLNVFWNLLVAPRYTNLRQYQSPGYNYSSEPGYFGAGLLTDKSSKKDVWVALFSKGKSGWIEVIALDKASFIQQFGIDNPDRYFSNWDPLVRLAGMNRFAVGENDLAGKWSNDFTNSTYYYNLHTGLYAGASTYASRQNFIFQSNKTYNWDLAAGSSSGGSMMKVDQAKATGNWKLLNNWQVWFSEIERKPKTYNAYFSCIKGGRILWLQDVSYGGYTAYGKVSN